MLDTQTKQFALEHRNDDVHRLLLQQAQHPEVDMAAAVTQIEGWRTACLKLPTWAANDAIEYPSRLAMEQCSSELTARYKASLVGGHTFADLTGGFGVDCSFMSEAFDEVTYVERNEQLFAFSSGNFATLGLTHIHPICGDGRIVLGTLPHMDWIYLDPARRDTAGRKVVSLADCEPDVISMEQELLAHADKVMVKCSPMLDISLACQQLENVSEVHVVAVKGECKELLLVLAADKTKGGGQSVMSDGQREKSDDKDLIPITCIDLPQGKPFTFTRQEETTCHCTFCETEVLGRYLYEPGTALLKGGCLRLPAARYGLQKLHHNTHLYTSDTLHADFPGRVFEVVASSGFGKRELRELLTGIKQANITVRNFPQSVDTLRHRLHLNDGGDDYLFATTIAGDIHRLIRCRKA